MISVCHVNLARGFTGAERQTEILIRGLAGWGLTQRFVGRKDGVLMERLGDLQDLDLRACGGGALAAAWAMRGAGLVHAHDDQGARAARLCHSARRKPYLITRSVNLPPSVSGASPKAYRAAARVVAASKGIRRVLRKFVPGLQPVLIPGAVANLARHPASISRLRKKYGDKFLIGCAGARRRGGKGQVALIAVATQFQRTHPDVHFLILSQGDGAISLAGAAKDLRNIEVVEQPDNLGNQLAVLDVYLIPTLREGADWVLLDALDCGVPIVACEAGGIVEFVQPEKTGLLFAADNVDQMHYALLRIYQNREFGRQMGARGAAMAADHTAEQMVERYLELYQPLLGSIGLAVENA